MMIERICLLLNKNYLDERNLYFKGKKFIILT